MRVQGRLPWAKLDEVREDEDVLLCDIGGGVGDTGPAELRDEGPLLGED